MKWFVLPIRLLLLPLSLIYGIILQIRNLFYDWKIFNIAYFPVPVISVGNLSAGGTGKTPFTIFLAQKLIKEFPEIAVISRGYGRKSRGLQLVSDGKKVLLNSEQAGDEPFLIAKKLAGTVVAVSENRRLAMQFVMDKFNVDLILLDDAFQHRSVHRDLDILLINASEPFRLNAPLPSGTLREFVFNYRRADIAVFTKQKKSTTDQQPSKLSIPFFSSGTRLSNLTDLDFRNAGAINDLKNDKIWAFAGIAHPKQFKDSLQTRDLKITGFTSFNDHYLFTQTDLKKLYDRAFREGCSVLLCTEKDLVKIYELREYWKAINTKGVKLLAVSLEFQLDHENQFIKKVKNHIDIMQ